MLALIVAVPVTLLQLVVGNRFGEAVTSAQSMKIAASEAQWDTCQPCGFSLFQIGGFTKDDPTPSFSITIPRLLSYMATGSFDGEVQGLNQLQAKEQSDFGPGNYMPNIRVTYWSMRVMAFSGVLMFLSCVPGLRIFRVFRVVRAVRIVRRLGGPRVLGELRQQLSSGAVYLVIFVLITVLEFVGLLELALRGGCFGREHHDRRRRALVGVRDRDY